MLVDLVEAERWSAEQFRTIQTARSSRSILCNSARPYELGGICGATCDLHRRDGVMCRNSRKHVTKHVTRNPLDVHHRLYNEAAIWKESRFMQADRFNAELLAHETSEVEKVKRRMRRSAQLCKDTRTHMEREAETLRKRAQWEVLGNKRRTALEDKEIQECTFRPKLCTTPRSFRVVDLGKLVNLL